MAGLSLICCGLVWFVAIPQLRNSIDDGLSEAVGTELSDQIPDSTIGPGEYTFSLGLLQDDIAQNADIQNVDDFLISSSGDRLEIGFVTGEQQLGYSGRPVVENGELVLEDMQVDNGVLGFVLPADRLGNAIEDGVNEYFAAQGLEIASLELAEGEIIFDLVEAGQ